jgi:hypothetical protein
MNAGKLARFTGLIFVLAACMGVAGSLGAGTLLETGGMTFTAVAHASAAVSSLLADAIVDLPADFVWT